MLKRDYDVIVWGATGFTGKWVAKYLFEHYPQDKLHWAMAGRNLDKLAQVREFIGDTESSVDGLLADSNDEPLLQKLVGRTKVIISTVGPYAYYGSLLVKACAKDGTHYVDLTGEVPWMRTMIDSHQAAAQNSGAKIVHSCGFDSIPSDMGNFYIQQCAHGKYGQYLKNVRFAALKMKGGMSGGTLHSLMNVIKEATNNKQTRKLLFNPYSLDVDPDFKGADGRDQNKVAYSEELGKWTAPFVMSAINTRVVRRSNSLLDFRYGKDFSYTETMSTSSGMAGYIAAKAISATIKLIGAFSITGAGRKLLGFVLPSQGQGPSVDPANPGYYVLEFNGETGNGEKLKVRVAGDADPGYGSTSKMLAEAAICLALDADKLALKGGFLTPSTAMGKPLLQRLQDNAGLTFELLDHV